MKFPPGQFWSRNVEPVAYMDLGGKPGFKMAIHKAGSRWYFYVAHLWEPGWSIVDITDPLAPRPVKFIPGPPNIWTIQIQIADGLMITGLEKIPPVWEGGTPVGVPFEEGFYIWSLEDPENPRRIGHYKTGGDGVVHPRHDDRNDP